MQRAGDELLARAALAVNENAAVCGSGEGDLLAESLHRDAFAKHPITMPEFLAKPAIFRLQAQKVERPFYRLGGFF